jgi:hypothetical protein
MRWPFRRRDLPAVEPVAAWTTVTVWSRPPMTTADTFGLPDVAGTRSLLARRVPMTGLDAPRGRVYGAVAVPRGVVPVRRSGWLRHLLARRPPVVPEPVRPWAVRVLERPAVTPGPLTVATDEYLAAPTSSWVDYPSPVEAPAAPVPVVYAEPDPITAGGWITDESISDLRAVLMAAREGVEAASQEPARVDVGDQRPVQPRRLSLSESRRLGIGSRQPKADPEPSAELPPVEVVEPPPTAIVEPPPAAVVEVPSAAVVEARPVRVVEAAPVARPAPDPIVVQPIAVQAVEPEPVEPRTPEWVTPASAEPELIEQDQFAPVAAEPMISEPNAPEAIAPERTTLEPIIPESITPEPVAQEPIAVVPVEPVTVAPVAVARRPDVSRHVVPEPPPTVVTPAPQRRLGLGEPLPPRERLVVDQLAEPPPEPEPTPARVVYSAHWTEPAPDDLVTVVGAAYGVDVSGTQVHRGTDVATRTDARAYTAAGSVYLPGPLTTTEARATLAHELTHVAQQRVLGTDLPAEWTPAGQALESEAVAAERWVLDGESGPPLVHAPVATVLATLPEPAAYGLPPTVATSTSDGVQRQPLTPMSWTAPDSILALFSDPTEPAGTDTPSPTYTPSTYTSPTIYSPPAHAAPQQETAPPPSPTAPPAEPTAALSPTGVVEFLPSPAEPVESTPVQSPEWLVDRELVERRERLFVLCGQRPANLDDVLDMEELAVKIYHRLRGLLRMELIVDRERAGLLTDFR